MGAENQTAKLNTDYTYMMRKIFLFALFIVAGSLLKAQTRLRLYDNYNSDNLYTNDTIVHTVWKPVLYADTLLETDKSRPWLQRKFFKEHLLQVQQNGFNIYGDVIINEQFGVSNRYNKKIGGKTINVKSPWIDTRGYEVSGNIGNKFYFETNFYENQGKFGGYIDSFIRKYFVIPSQNNYKNIGDGSGFDFSSSSARLTYVPNKHLLFDLGYGKNFIGDGYRSLLLSDCSISYPYFRTSLTFNKFQYSVMWSEYLSTVDKSQYNKLGLFRKWAQTYVIDWNAAPGLNLSLFESVIWPDQTHTPGYRGKDVSPWLASPVIFLHGSSSPSGVSNNDVVGLNAKLKIYSRSYVYGQVIVDELGKSSSFKNRTGFQLGLRSNDVFEMPGLNFLAEFNTVRPYTYAAASQDVSYSNANQALGDPLGANFTEGLVLATYRYKKWNFRLEGFVATYGVDSGSANYGHNVLALLPLQPPVSGSVTTGQGVSTKLTFVDFKTAYTLNPQSNLRIEAGLTYRREHNDLANYKDVIFSIGVRTSFNNLLYDF